MLDKDDTALKFYRKQMMTTMRSQEHASQPSSVFLRKRAQELHEEDVKKAKRYKEEERLVAEKEKDQTIVELNAETIRLEAKNKELAQILLNKEFEEEQNQAKFRAKVYRCWFQTMYPAILADRCIQMYMVEMKLSRRKDFPNRVHRHWHEGFFNVTCSLTIFGSGIKT